MKGTLLLLPALLMATAGNAQEYEPVPEVPPQQGLTLTVKMTPTFLLDRFAATIPLAAELGFLDRLSFSAEYGIPFNGTELNWSGAQEKTLVRNLRLGTQLRVYFRKKVHSSMFIGLEAFYKVQEYTRDSAGYTGYLNTAYEVSKLNARKTVAGVSIITGTRQWLGERFCVDLYAGLGRKVADNVFLFAERSARGTDPRATINEDHREGTSNMFYIPFGISFGYQFGK